jgi:cytosine/adenosine deaminase-related metal-dependent hydrolase
VILQAGIVVPVRRPPIENGAVRIQDGRITEVGDRSQIVPHLGEHITDLGDQVLMPGLVNSHCHLDYTHMAGMIPPCKGFADWIKSINAIKSSWSDAHFQDSWIDGAHQLLQSGTTTVANVESVHALLPAIRFKTPLRIISFFEVIGIRKERRPEELLEPILSLADACRQAGHVQLGLSPHALYSTTPALLAQCQKTARERNWRLMIHLAESADEAAMFENSEGPLFDWLRAQRDMSELRNISPVQMAGQAGLLNSEFLAIHANYLAPGDVELLARSLTSVVHCPRSHAYFRHTPFLHESLRKAGVNICLGTDSMATVIKERDWVPTLDMFAESRAFAAYAGLVPASSILAMVTLNPARALGLEGLAGEISPGSWADLVALPCTSSAAEAEEEIVNFSGKPSGVMISGQWVVRRTPHAFN